MKFLLLVVLALQSLAVCGCGTDGEQKPLPDNGRTKNSEVTQETEKAASSTGRENAAADDALLQARRIGSEYKRLVVESRELEQEFKRLSHFHDAISGAIKNIQDGKQPPLHLDHLKSDHRRTWLDYYPKFREPMNKLRDALIHKNVEQRTDALQNWLDSCIKDKDAYRDLKGFGDSVERYLRLPTDVAYLELISYANSFEVNISRAEVGIEMLEYEIEQLEDKNGPVLIAMKNDNDVALEKIKQKRQGIYKRINELTEQFRDRKLATMWQDAIVNYWNGKMQTRLQNSSCTVQSVGIGSWPVNLNFECTLNSDKYSLSFSFPRAIRASGNAMNQPAWDNGSIKTFEPEFEKVISLPFCRVDGGNWAVPQLLNTGRSRLYSEGGWVVDVEKIGKDNEHVYIPYEKFPSVIRALIGAIDDQISIHAIDDFYSLEPGQDASD